VPALVGTEAETDETQEMSLVRRTLYPELAFFEPPEEADRVFFEFSWNRRWGWTVPAAGAAGTLLLARGASVIPWTTLGLSRDVVAVLVIVLVVLWNAVIVGLWHRLIRTPLRHHLREELVTRGVVICLDCGYDLRGQIEPRCPECGKPFDKRLLHRTPQSPSNETNGAH
jgi:hypothetical protein